MSKNEKYEKSYTPEKSSNYIKPGQDGGLAGFNNNSPYRDNMTYTLKPTLTHSPSKIGTESYRSRNLNQTNYETNMRRGSTRRDN